MSAKLSTIECLYFIIVKFAVQKTDYAQNLQFLSFNKTKPQNELKLCKKN
jgi:hypothetical protein